MKVWLARLAITSINKCCCSNHSLNVMIVVSAILRSSLSFLFGSKSSGHPPNSIASTSPGHRVMAVVEWPDLGRVPSGSVTWR